MNNSYNNTKKLIASAATLMAGVGIRFLTRKLWTKVNGTPPPENPAKPDVKMGEAIAWTLSVAVLSGLAKLFMKKKFEEETSGYTQEIADTAKNINE